MVISRCCHNEIYVILDYYVCGICHKPCNTIDSTLLLVKDYSNDTRIIPEIKKPINAS